MLAGAATVLFAVFGYDAMGTAAEEAGFASAFSTVGLPVLASITPAFAVVCVSVILFRCTRPDSPGYQHDLVSRQQQPPPGPRRRGTLRG